MSARSRWLVVVLVALVLLVAALVPGDGAAVLGPFGVVGRDKWLHALGYGALAATVTFADGRARVGVVAAIGYGGFTELLQVGVPTRTASALDATADLVGAVAGGLLVVALAAAYARYADRASPHSTADR